MKLSIITKSTIPIVNRQFERKYSKDVRMLEEYPKRSRRSLDLFFVDGDPDAAHYETL